MECSLVQHQSKGSAAWGSFHQGYYLFSELQQMSPQRAAGISLLLLKKFPCQAI
jgi:hypothetical protein